MKRILHTAALSLPVIIAAALGLRLYLLRNYVIHHARQALGTIPFLFEPGNIAYSLAGGHGFSSPFHVETGPTAWMTPVWPLLLAAIFRIFGTYTFQAFLAAALMNVLFSTLVCVPLHFAGKRIAGREVGAAAAWLWSISPVAAVLPFESLWEGSLAALLTALILWATVAVIGSVRTWAWIAYGLLWGAALLTSAAFLALFVLIHGWLAWRSGGRKPMVAAGIAILCCLPWTVRNFAVFHAFVPLRSVMGLSLWVGNNDRADGLTPNRHPISNSAERARYEERGEIAYMRDKRTEAIAFMWSHPGTELRLTRDRFVAFWSGGTPRPMTDFLHPPARAGWFRWVVLFNLLGAAGGAAGIAILFRRHSGSTLPVALFPLVFPLPYYMTIALPRYRLPVDPALLLLAAIALQAIWQTISRGSAPGGGSTRTTSHK